MPATRQGGGYTLTFSKANKDVKDILDDLKESKKEKITDYLCKCVRFYENNKNKNIGPGDGPINEEAIKSIVEKQIKEILDKNNIICNSNNSNNILEKDLDDVNIDED